MSVPKITPQFTPKNITITQDMNKGRVYLYNEVLQTVRKNQVPAELRNSGIKITSASENLIKALKELKINFLSK